MTFHVGQRVVCIRTQEDPLPGWVRQPWPDDIRLGEVYTISATRMLTSEVLGVQVQEHLSKFAHLGLEEWFDAACFRPVKTTSIEVFRRMLAPVKEDA
jgi:hypothetical protein